MNNVQKYILLLLLKKNSIIVFFEKEMIFEDVTNKKLTSISFRLRGTVKKPEKYYRIWFMILRISYNDVRVLLFCNFNVRIFCGFCGM